MCEAPRCRRPGAWRLTGTEHGRVELCLGHGVAWQERFGGTLTAIGELGLRLARLKKLKQE